MEEADKLCDEIAIINQGKIITSDSPRNLKKELKADTITIKVDYPDDFVEKVKELNFIKDAFLIDGEVKLMVESGENLIPAVVEFASNEGFPVKSVELEHPNLEDVFIKFTGSKISSEGK